MRRTQRFLHFLIIFTIVRKKAMLYSSIRMFIQINLLIFEYNFYTS